MKFIVVLQPKGGIATIRYMYIDLLRPPFLKLSENFNGEIGHLSFE